MELDQHPITNSACYSPITATTASWLSVVFYFDNTKTPPQMVAKNPASEAPSINTGNYSQMNTWFTVLMQDTLK